MAQLTEVERRQLLNEGNWVMKQLDEPNLSLEGAQKLIAQGRRIQAKLAESSTQRKTQVVTEDYQDLVEEPSYETNPLGGVLHPSRWKALANPRTVWPSDLDPQAVLKEMCSLYVYDRILQPDAAARGQTVAEKYGLHSYDEI